MTASSWESKTTIAGKDAELILDKAMNLGQNKVVKKQQAVVYRDQKLPKAMADRASCPTHPPTSLHKVWERTPTQKDAVSCEDATCHKCMSQYDSDTRNWERNRLLRPSEQVLKGASQQAMKGVSRGMMSKLSRMSMQ